LGLRTDVTGKVVHYLQDNGADVKVGEPFVEVEAMKMSMPIKATESGKITQNLSPASVINVGDLPGSLELKDPSKVKKILPSDGDFDIEFTPHTFSSREALFNILASYNYDAEATVAAAFQDTDNIESAIDLAIEIVDDFVRVESMFDSQLKDDGVRQMSKDNSESLDTIIALNPAHQKLSKRASLLPFILSVYQEQTERLFKVLMNWREINPTINILKDVTLYSLPMM
jgi:acetyl-CoA carboxylase/biotin carboxylase 1